MNCNSTPEPNESWPFKTKGTHYVYAKAGEIIAVASSAQGYKKGIITLTPPVGVAKSTAANSSIGRIPNRLAELAGPATGRSTDNVNCYKPYTVEVDESTEGIWKIEFLPPSGLNGEGKPLVPKISANASWKQSSVDPIRSDDNIDEIAAWDVSVMKKGGSEWLKGRVYANVLNLHLYQDFTEGSAYYVSHYVLTKDGRAYRVNTNGSNGVAFTFFSNSNGFARNSVPTYKSFDKSNLNDILEVTHNPTLADVGTNTTHKIFYNKPNPDLPAKAKIGGFPEPETWLKNTAVRPEITNLKIIGAEGSPGLAGKNGARIQFESSTVGTYRITIPVKIGNGPIVNRVIIGVANTGFNSVYWDGKDGNGNYLLPAAIVSTLKTKLQSAEVHFPYIDMEINPNGLIIELTNNTTEYLIEDTSTDESIYSSRTYWDDSDITGAGTFLESSKPHINNVTGSTKDEVDGMHKWGIYTGSAGANGTKNSGSGLTSFGNTRSMDTWAYIQGSEVDNPINLTVKVADLKVLSITPDLSSFLLNKQITYTVKVKNDGPSDVTGATFAFKSPTGFEIDPAVPVGFDKPGLVRNASTIPAKFTATVDLNNQAELTFTITGKMTATAIVYPISAEASMLRPADVTDPDATNPNPDAVGPPTDPHLECLNGTAVEGCNNIKYHDVNLVDICAGSAITNISYAGAADQVSVLMPVVIPGLTFTPNTAGKSMLVTGMPTADGTFTLGTVNNDRKKTTYLIHVAAVPVVTIPQDLVACKTKNIVIESTATGVGNTYQWQYKDGSNAWQDFVASSTVVGPKTAALTLKNVPLSFNNRNIKVIVTSPLGCKSEAVSVLKVSDLPLGVLINYNDEGLFCEGTAVKLSVNTPHQKQWFKDGILVQDGGDFYMASSSGLYSILLTNEFGCSEPGVNKVPLTFNPVPTVSAITIDGDPVICSGDQVKLLVTNVPNVTYQWKNYGASIPGATSSFYYATAAGYYSVTVKNASGCNNVSDVAQVIVRERAVAADITAADQTICAGGTVVLSAESTLDEPIFTWYTDALLQHVLTDLTVNPSVTTDYFVTVRSSDLCDNSAAEAKKVTVFVNTILKPEVTIAEREFCEGSHTVLTSSSSTGNQWYKDGTAIAGATNPTLEVSESGTYTVKISANGCTSEASADAVITVHPVPVKPDVTIGAREFCEGSHTILTSSSSTGNQWYNDGIAIAGATNPTLEVSESGTYTLKVSANGCTSEASADAVIRVHPVPVKPDVTIGEREFCEGSHTILTSSSSTGNQWYKDGVLLVGEINPELTVTASGNYTLKVSANGCTSEASADAVIRVHPVPVKPDVTIAEREFCEGSHTILTSSSSTGNQWYNDGIAIAGATNPTLEVSESGTYTVKVTSNGCTSEASADVVITVHPIPVKPDVTIAAREFCEGSHTILTSSSSTGNQWYKDGIAIAGATNSTLEVSESGTYTLKVSANGCTSEASADAVITVHPVPVKPDVTIAEREFCEGSHTILTSSSSTGNQWYKDGIAIAGATNPTLGVSESGTYTVKVSANGCTSEASADAVITVHPIPAKPDVTIAEREFCEGGRTILTSSSATGNQWYKDGVLLVGEINPELTVTAGGTYTVKVSANGCTSEASADAVITVHPIPAKPEMTIAEHEFCEGSHTILTSSSSTGNQWYKDGIAIAGATNPTLEVSESGTYTVKVTSNGCTSEASADAVIRVHPVPVKPDVTIAEREFCEGSHTILSSSSATGNQWYKDGTAIAGATNPTLEVSESGTYTVKVSANGCTSEASADAVITVHPIPVKPEVTIAEREFCEGSHTLLTSSASLGNQWYKNGTAIAGATNPTLEVSESGTYTLKVSANGCISEASADAVITVHPVPVKPEVTIAEREFCEGSHTILTSSSATGNQWYKDGTAIVGATNPTLEVSESGTYTVKVSANGCTSEASADAVITVHPVPVKPDVTIAEREFCEGSHTILSSSSATGNQWYKDGTAIAGATNPTLEVSESGIYTVKVSANGCTSEASADAVITVHPVPVKPDVTIAEREFCEGSHTILSSSSATGNQWYKDGSPISGATNPTLEVSESGIYTVKVSVNGCTSEASADAVITVHPIPVKPEVTIAEREFCEGSHTILSSSSATGNQWYKDGTAIAGATNPTLEVSESGTYTVKVSANGCTSEASADAVITVHPVPVKPDVTIAEREFCEGSHTILSSSSATGNQWYKDGTAIAGATNPTLEVSESGTYMVKVSANGCTSEASVDAVITVHPIPAKPDVTIAEREFCEGSHTILSSSSATGNQWYKDGTAIAGAINPTLEVSESGTYTVKVSVNGCTSEASADAVITVHPVPVKPEVTIAEREFCEGGRTILTSSSATGNKWYKNGTAIAGATNPTLEVSESGTYTVKVSANGCTSEASADAVITVHPVPVKPEVTIAEREFCEGGRTILTSSSSTGNQWYKNGIAIAGATNPTLEVSESGTYMVKVSVNGCTSEASADAVITVHPVPVKPEVTIAEREFCEGGRTILTSSSATGNQWYKNGTAIAGATNPTLEVSESGTYTVKVSANGCTGEASADAVITVHPIPAKPDVTIAEREFCEGGRTILTSSSSTGNQWYKNGIVIAGATNPTLEVSESGTYTVKVSANGCTSEVSADAVITVHPIPAKPDVTIAEREFCEGSHTILSSSSATGNQWYKDGTAIAGATNPTLEVSESGTYTVKVSANGCTSETSADAVITVHPVPVKSDVTIAEREFCEGSHTILGSSSATGNQWYKDGTAIAGATNPTLEVSESGTYTVKVSANGCTSEASADAVITVHPVPVKPDVTIAEREFCEGNHTLLTSSASLGNQWYKDGTAISGATNPTLEVSESGTYTVKISANGCTSEASADAVITVHPVPVKPDVTIAEREFCEGSHTILTSSASLGNQWYKDGTAISGATNPTLEVSESGTYTVKVSANGCTSEASVDAVITVHPVPVKPDVTIAEREFCEGSHTILTSSSSTGNQWYKDGTAIAGAINPTLEVSESGTYTVKVTSNGCTSEASADAVITVHPVPVKPDVTMAEREFCEGNHTILTSSSSTGNQWYKDGTAIAGATNPTLEVSESGAYTVKVTSNGCTSEASADAVITVHPVPVKPDVTIAEREFCEGSHTILTSSSSTGNQWYKDGIAIAGATNPTLEVSESGTYTLKVSANGCTSEASADAVITVHPVPVKPEVTIAEREFCEGSHTILTSSSSTGNQWYKDGTAIAGATNPTLEVSESGTYTVKVSTNGCTSEASADAVITVHPVPVKPEVTIAEREFCEGSHTILSSSFSTGNQWYKDGIAIAGATNPTLEVSESGTYTVKVSANGCTSEASADAVITVHPVPVKPDVTIAEREFCEGSHTILTSSSSTGNQWYKDGTAIAGATNPTLEVSESGTYTVKVSANGCTSEASADAVIRVHPVPVKPDVTIAEREFCEGSHTILTSSSSTGNQWYKDGIAIAGATNPTLEVSESGTYTVKVSANGCTSEASADAVIRVHPVPVKPDVTIAEREFCEGSHTILTSSSSTGNQWYKDGIAIAGATNPTLEVSESGTYTLKVSANGCTSEASADAVITVHPVPVKPDVTIAEREFCEGGHTLLTSSSSTGNQWYKDGIAIAGATNPTLEVSESGTYTVKVTSNGCTSEASADAVIRVHPVPVKPDVTIAEREFCEGSHTILTSSSSTGNQWYKDGIAVAGATNPTLEVSESGTYTLKVSANGCTSDASADAVITVHSIPNTPTISATEREFCEGGHTLLTSSTTQGNQWYKDGIAIAGATNPTLEVSQSGIYTVKVTLNTCSSQASIAIKITVNPIPAAPTITATNHAVFCEGGNVVLTSSENNGNQWYKNGILIPGATGKNYTATTPGDYSLNFTNSNGCASPISLATPVTEVQYPEQPQISPSNETTFCEGRVVILSSSENIGNQWYKNGILIPGATGKTYSVSEIGIYTVTVTNTEGCTSAVSATTTVTVSPVPKGFDDTVSPLSCGQSSFNYPLQANINNRAKGGNAIPSTFSWTVNSPVLGAVNGAGNTIITDLYNPTAIAQVVTYVVTPRGLAGGCDGTPFKITITVPACIGLSITKTADKHTVSAAGDQINYTITVRNTGSASHHNVNLSDPLIAGNLRLTGDNGNGVLEREESWIYTGTYTVTQSDLDRNGVPTANIGKIQNTATVQSTEHPLVVSATADVAIDQNPNISLVKTGRLNTDLKTITYTFVIKNIGNVTLHHLVLSDPKIPGVITLPGTTLAPNASITHQENYTITEDEKLNGNVRNTAQIDGLTEIGEQVSDLSGTNESNDIPTDIDVKRYPAAVDDFANTKTDQEVMVAVAKNDKPSLFPLDVSTIEVQMAPANGTLQMNKDGKIVYLPKKGYSGIEKFSYKIHDAVGISSNVAIVTINVVPPDLEIPNTFTPNGDGKNDTFQIVGRENYENIDLAVFNRWGDQVYKNNNYKDEWDGAGLNDGTYFYVLKLTKGGVVTSRKSWILIKR
ncbi:Ig-like domain-containing protein [Pedobacter sp. PACM 27299]|uniref:Ig-like domain-containing protein n=1 Tax=Pedobacter sp. PACM 27299 TaxID=1727164 RepID=UPI0012F7CECA|nr:gliding motility-associated C-terminal domain-containing protein [Pedobacter sp. PACM 27299]